MIDISVFNSPIGSLTLGVRDGVLCALCFDDHPNERKRILSRYKSEEIRDGENREVTRLLQEYFEGHLEALGKIEVEPSGTPFQLRVWAQLREIPPGETIAYSDLARAIGSPAAVRAVGTANGANPIAVVIPCHRVIGANGTLTGYGGGLERKRWLLDHEERYRSTPRPGFLAFQG